MSFKTGREERPDVTFISMFADEKFRTQKLTANWMHIQMRAYLVGWMRWEKNV
jgi:hypothetical protein